MDQAKKARLEKDGWRFGEVADFLELTPEQAAYIELKVALVDHLRRLRTETDWTQTQLALRLGSSQSRVAKMEAGDPSVSVDLLIRTLLALGASREELGSVIGRTATPGPCRRAATPAPKGRKTRTIS
jgi:DNA-binding XRE family transcriptional regulator